MKNLRRKALLIATAVFCLSVSSFAQNPCNWSYGSISTGPASWATNYPSCGATTGQSPIVIPSGLTPTPNMSKVTYNYNKTENFLVENINYATELVAPNPTTNTIQWNGTTYNLIQIHFHFPAEHQIPGNISPVLEEHFVHQDPTTGNYLVIAVVGAIGNSNGAVETVWNNLPPSYGGHGTLNNFNPISLLPEGGSGASDFNYYNYVGSLTAPPCSPGITWLVLKRYIQISKGQLTIAKWNNYPNARAPLSQTPAPTVKESNF